MKKVVSILMVLFLLMAMMTGCGGSSGSAENDQTETEQNEQSENIAADTGEMGDLLSAAYVDMMKNKEYLMSYKATMEIEGQSMDVEATIAVSGDDYAMISSGEGFESSMIIKEDKVYMIDHTSKTVTSWAQTQGDEPETFAPDGLIYVGNGKENGLAYEEYNTPDTDNTVKYYFDGKDLVKI
ncbi:MAG: hypothetical protein AAGU75_04565, partial [Bacillota bacterium]